jgi:predicted ferric reductase
MIESKKVTDVIAAGHHNGQWVVRKVLMVTILVLAWVCVYGVSTKKYENVQILVWVNCLCKLIGALRKISEATGIKNF